MAPATECFRFLNLPIELRLIVYGNAATYHTVTLEVDEPWIERSCPLRGTLTTRTFTFSVALLATCKLVKQEAEPVFTRVARDHPVRMLQSFPDNGLDGRISGFLFHRLSYIDAFVTLMKEVGWTESKKQSIDKYSSTSM